MYQHSYQWALTTKHDLTQHWIYDTGLIPYTMSRVKSLQTVVITRSYLSRYYIRQIGYSGKWIRYQNHNRHPISRPQGELWGVYCDDFGETWPPHNSTALDIAQCKNGHQYLIQNMMYTDRTELPFCCVLISINSTHILQGNLSIWQYDPVPLN